MGYHSSWFELLPIFVCVDLVAGTFKWRHYTWDMTTYTHTTCDAIKMSSIWLQIGCQAAATDSVIPKYW